MVGLAGVSDRAVHFLDLYWRSLESGDLWYSSRQLKETICWWVRQDWREYDIYSPFDDGYDSDSNQVPYSSK